jgi:pilus assembly protein CpaD
MLTRLFRSSALVLVTALVACGPLEDRPATDYREKYPVQVTAETVSLALPLPLAAGAMTPEDETRFGAIVAGYLDRGHGPLTLVAGTRNGSPGFAELDAVREKLLAAGVPENAIRLVSLPQLPGNVVTLRYERYNALVPVCGDWSSHAGHDYSNNVHSNFGCANQRNMGLMLADPADLQRMREAAPTDTQNANRVMQRYRKGEPTAATPSPLQIQGGTGIVKQ